MATTKRKVIAIILTILIWGLGHAYLGCIKRGVVLFFLGLGIMIVVSFLIPFPFSVIVGLIYLGWLISDVLRIIKLENGRGMDYNASTRSVSYQKCGSTNREDSSYCIKCGSPLR
jgi:TM2 domain-containing membrane protein YozV